MISENYSMSFADWDTGRLASTIEWCLGSGTRLPHPSRALAEHARSVSPFHKIARIDCTYGRSLGPIRMGG